MKKISLLIFTLLHALFLGAENPGIYILVHGTWGADAEWHQSSSDFYKTLEVSAQRYNKKIVSFTWSGKFNHKNRVKAAKQLVKLICSYPEHTSINIISHSHGSNVGNIASQLLSESKQHKNMIDSFFAFGTPVDTKKYMPNMNAIKRYYNFFSYNDWVQPILGFFERVYPPHHRIANLRLIIDCMHPSHRSILVPAIARWLPDFPDKLSQQRMGNFEHFNFSHPGVVHFSSAACPTYSIESRYLRLLEGEPNIIALIASTIELEKSHKINA